MLTVVEALRKDLVDDRTVHPLGGGEGLCLLQIEMPTVQRLDCVVYTVFAVVDDPIVAGDGPCR